MQFRLQLDKVALFLLCLVPFAFLVWDAFTNGLGINPVETLTHRSGDWTLRLLLITLAISPLRQITARTQFMRYRRMLGLFAFFYAVLHVTIYFWIDQSLLWTEILADIVKRPYITVGFSAFVILIPLALTSTKGMMRRLGKRWKKLHRGIYLSAGLGVIHFLWLTRADTREPMIYLGIFVLLMLFRVRKTRQA